jgi:putative hydrolase of the HAD superfamily
MRAILWDFDGTLGERVGGWSDALLAAVERVAPGLGLTPEQVRPRLQRGFPWHTPDRPCAPPHTAQGWWAALEPVFINACQGCGLPEGLAARVAVEVRHTYLDPGAWRLYDDALPTLGRLSAAGWRHVVLSNHVPELRDLLATLGLAPLLMGVVNSAETGYEKPHPEAFRLGVAAAQGATTIWMIGDNPVADIAGAEAAGLPAILVRRTHSDASYASANLAGVPALLVHALE